MSRRIVFAGGTQTRALARVYRGEVAAHTGDELVFIGTGAAGTDAARSALLMADTVVMEIDEDEEAIPADGLPGQANVIRVPNLYCDFLWPFAGRSHPRNRGVFALPGGPYPAEHGDRFLDQMLAEGVDETTAIARYLAIDIAVAGELDQRLAARLAIMARLDAASGFDLAAFITDRFRTEPLFRTRQRLTLKLAARLVDQLFAKMGVAGWRAASLRRVPFPAGAQPIHPGVIAHFGLAWARADGRTPLNEEGFFTFEEFCRRYMGFIWNEALHRGFRTARTDLAAALTDLERGVAESPDSPLGKLVLEAARRASVPGGGPADPALIIDQDSYEPAGEEAPGRAAVEDDLIAEATPRSAFLRKPSTPNMAAAGAPAAPEPGSTADRFTTIHPAASPQPAMVTPGITQTDALSTQLPVFAELSSNVDRPFGAMAEIMPPPPLRPSLPPELQEEAPRPGLLARMLGRR